MKDRVLITLLLTLSMSVPSVAQQPAPAPSQSPTSQSSTPAPQQTASGEDDVVRITANLVQVDAVVTDRKGKQITNLSDQDFEILEDGRAQKITNLSYVTIKSPMAAPKLLPLTAVNDKAAPPVHLRPEQVH